MKKLEIIIKPEKLESLKNILDDCEASGLMITNIMGYGNQKGYTRMYRGTTYNVNLLPKVKVETVVADDAAEKFPANDRANHTAHMAFDGSVRDW